MNNMVGNRVGKYELIRLLGHGGMAEVYEAFQPGTERSVAIKVLRGYSNETPESVARFKREARSIAQLRHTNIVQVFDFDIDEALYYMVMEYIRGGTLSQIIRDGGMMSPAVALRIMIQLADALSYAHEHGVIHRDIKPVNIMFTDAAHKHPVVTDFGIARIMGDPALTADGRFMGSPAYISPEVVRGLGADARSDIYGLGLTFYEMLTAQRPYKADSTSELIVQHLSAPLPSPSQFNPAVTPSLESVLKKALAKDRERRYQSAAEFKRVLERTLESLEGHPVAASSATQTKDLTPDVSTAMPVQMDDERGDTLPFDEPVDSRTRTQPFEEYVPTTTEVEEKPRRRSPILVFIVLIALLGLGGYLALSQRQAVAGDNATATQTQPAVIQATSTTVSAVGDFTAIASATATLSPTPTATNTPAPTLTLEVAHEKEGSIVKPTAAPTDTATATPQATNTSRPRPTQLPGQSKPTSAPAQPTNDPGSSGGGSSGGSGSTGDGASGGGSNPVQDTVDDVTDTVNDAAQPVIDIIQHVIPTVCLLGCH